MSPREELVDRLLYLQSRRVEVEEAESGTLIHDLQRQGITKSEYLRQNAHEQELLKSLLEQITEEK